MVYNMISTILWSNSWEGSV